ncbi:hypothetical protein RUESEDTHA_02147 [Ruegeria sp. THAF57]|uniref:hypothetical protein n=1 Tax=Ruegeria sp. THAF57 TaxID=2744555 RepID=UPI0015DEB683|nr:hypothetical protein [Ruegeria sp. THAF57]CAD0185261.1 hypothetical protein RUESEDTHA_02147 [Ruegeria sp. THAF57]
MLKVSKLIFNFKRKRALRKLNKANTFKKLQLLYSTPEEIVEAERNAERWKATKHLRPDWEATAHVINMHETSPDSAGGQAFLNTLDAHDIHYLARQICYDGMYDEAWVLAFVKHPECDLGTGWLLFLGSGSPMSIEKYLRDNADKDKPFGIFKDDVERNDIILARMKACDFFTRDFAPNDPKRIREYKVEMKDALSEGKSLRWQVPDDAFKGLRGFDAKSKYEQSFDDVLINFDLWLANRQK